MEKNKIRKKFVKILIIFMILLIFCMSVILYITSKNSSQTQIEYINSDEWNGELYPDGMPNLFRNYSGSLTCQNIGKSFYYVTNTVIPKYAKECKNYTQTQIEEYFENNKESIALDIGIRKKEEFYDLITKINNLTDLSELEFEKFYINAETVNKQSGVTKADLCIKYKNCDVLTLNVRINSSKTSNVSAVKYN